MEKVILRVTLQKYIVIAEYEKLLGRKKLNIFCSYWRKKEIGFGGGGGGGGSGGGGSV
jgi:uncharacterized membrane protein YgcG